MNANSVVNLFLLQDVLTPSYLLSCDIAPETAIIALYDDFKTDLHLIASPRQKRFGAQMQLMYDTSFSICKGMYISFLSMRHPLLKGEPMILLGYMLHSRKHKFYHERFFQLVTDRWPVLAKMDGSIITDREFRIRFTDYFPKMTHLYCHNHIVSIINFMHLFIHNIHSLRICYQLIIFLSIKKYGDTGVRH